MLVMTRPINALRAAIELLIDTFTGWLESRAPLHASALAFHTLTSLAPMLIIALIVVGPSYHREMSDFIIAMTADMGGKEAAGLVREIIDRTSIPSNIMAVVISLALLLYGATSVVLGLQDSIGSMWNLEAKHAGVGRSAAAFARHWIISAAAALIFGYILLILLLLNTIWSTFYDQFVRSQLLILGVMAPPASLWGSLAMYVLIFALVFKFLLRTSIHWRDLIVGAGLTALLFWLGNYLIKLYLARIFFISIYGAAGSIVVFLLWVNYSAMIVLFGARFTYVYASRRGRDIRAT